MHRSERTLPLVRRIQFGFDADRLYVRVDAHAAMIDALADGEPRDISLTFVSPPQVRFTCRQTAGRLTGVLERDPAAASPGLEDAPQGVSVAAGAILEIAIPVAALGVGPGQEVTFFVAIGRRGVEVERHPADHPIQVTVPDRSFGARLWRA
jgi:hypothetical protein